MVVSGKIVGGIHVSQVHKAIDGSLSCAVPCMSHDCCTVFRHHPAGAQDAPSEML